MKELFLFSLIICSSCTSVSVKSNEPSPELGPIARMFVVVFVDKSFERNILHFEKSFAKLNNDKELSILVDGQAYDPNSLDLTSQKKDFSKQLVAFHPDVVMTIALARRISVGGDFTNEFRVSLFSPSAPDNELWTAYITVKTSFGGTLTNADVDEIVRQLLATAKQHNILRKI